MSLRAQVETIRADDPSAGVASALDPAFAVLPPARELLVAVVDFGEGPGVSVSPWALAGVVRAARHHGLSATGHDLGPRPVNGGLERRSVAAGLPLREEDPRPIQLEVPGGRRPRRIPHGWFGRHLCLVVPCVHRRIGTGRGASWIGPVASAWARFDRACSGPEVKDASSIGARLAAQVFASTTVLIDASWWGSMGEDETSPAELLAVQRALCLSTPTPDEGFARRTVEAPDDWLAAKLGVATHRTDTRALQVRGSGRDDWPRAPKLGQPGRGPGLAGQAVEALWKRGRRPRPAPIGRSLTATVPGPLARAWNGHGESARPASPPAPTSLSPSMDPR